MNTTNRGVFFMEILMITGDKSFFLKRQSPCFRRKVNRLTQTLELYLLNDFILNNTYINFNNVQNLLINLKS